MIQAELWSRTWSYIGHHSSSRSRVQAGSKSWKFLVRACRVVRRRQDLQSLHRHRKPPSVEEGPYFVLPGVSRSYQNSRKSISRAVLRWNTKKNNKQVFCGGNLFEFHGSVPLRPSPRKRVECGCRSRKKRSLKISGKNFKCLSRAAHRVWVEANRKINTRSPLSEISKLSKREL